MRIAGIKPDWEDLWTAKEAEAGLSEEWDDFSFNGPGFYIGKDEVLLVFPQGDIEEPWNQEWPEDQKFVFFSYIQRNPADVFNAIINAPVRLDRRDQK